jgi:hypothetical protein
MRISVIKLDNTVTIDGESIKNIDLSALDDDIHAIQWYDTEGEIERVDSRGRIIANEEITSFDDYQWIVDAWQAAKEASLALALNSSNTITNG